MALVTTTVSDTISLADGTAPGAVLKFTPTGFDTDGQVIANEAVQVTLDAAGAFSVDLWPNDRGVRGTSYIVRLLVVVNGRNAVRSYGSITVPATGPVAFNTLLGVTQAQLPTTNALAAQSAAAAAADSLATAADRVQTGLDAAATAADRVQTGLDAASASTSASSAAASAAAAALAAGYGPVIKNDNILTGDLTLAAGFNGMTVGPIEIAAGVTMDVASGSVWAII